MNIFERFVSNPEYSDQAPEAIRFDAKPRCIYAPVAGDVVQYEVDSMKLFGKGLALDPAAEVIYAPVSGRIKATTITNHAIGITTDDGVDVLIHIGLGTVAMNGRGFVRFVQAGEHVEAGQPLIAFDDRRVLESGFDDVVAVVVTNADEIGEITYQVDDSVTVDGHPIVKPGELLFSIG